MTTVDINGIKYIVTTPASDDIDTSFDSIHTDPILSVSGEGYRADDPDKTPVQIIWHLDGDTEFEDASDWRTDWSTADEAIEVA